MQRHPRSAVLIALAAFVVGFAVRGEVERQFVASWWRVEAAGRVCWKWLLGG